MPATPITTLRSDRFIPVEVYQISHGLVLRHEGMRDSVELEPVAEAALLEYLLSRVTDRLTAEIRRTPPADA